MVGIIMGVGCSFVGFYLFNICGCGWIIWLLCFIDFFCLYWCCCLFCGLGWLLCVWFIVVCRVILLVWLLYWSWDCGVC